MEKYILKYIGDETSDFAPFKLIPINEWDGNYYIDKLGFIKDKGFAKFGEGISTWGSIFDKKKEKKALIGIAYNLEDNTSAYAGFIVEKEPGIYELVDCSIVYGALDYTVRKEILTIYRIKKVLDDFKKWLFNYKEFKKILESLALGYVLYKSMQSYPITIESFNHKEFYYYLYKNDLKGILDQDTYLKITKIEGWVDNIKDVSYILDLAKRFIEAQKPKIIKE